MKLLKIISSAVLVLVIAGISFSQETVDAEVKIYLDSFYELEYEDQAKAKVYLDSAIERSSFTFNSMTHGRVQLYKGWYYQDISKFDSSRACFYKSLEHYTKAKSYSDIADVYGNLGNAYLDIQDIKMALEFQLKSLNLNETIISFSADRDLLEKAEKGRAYAWTNISAIYTIIGEPQKSLEYQMKGLAYEQENNDSVGMAISYVGLGTNYKNLNKLDSAVWYTELAYRIFKANKQENGLLNTCLNLYQYNYKIGIDRYDLLFEAHDLAVRGKNKHAQVQALQSLIGSNYLFSKDSLNRMIKTANRLIDEYDFDVSLGEYFRVEANYYAANGEFKKAFNSQQRFLDYFARTKSAEKEVDFKSAELRNEFLKKSMQDSLNYVETIQQHKIEKEIEISAQNRIITIIIFGIIVLAIFLAFLLRAFKLKKKTNEQLNSKNVLIERQRDMVEEKNREITDSITYAERLQSAILPPLSFMQSELPMFVYFKPKDVVSGDFYWFEKKDDFIYVAAADCTGHGVPGAMVSVVCSNALNRSLNEFDLQCPSKILDKTRELVINTFSKSGENVRDGMDISLCRFDLKKKELLFSGAYNPLWIVRNNSYISQVEKEKTTTIIGNQFSLIEVKGDKQPIGLYGATKEFSVHTIELLEDDMFYLFTDGYADQFGGDNGKKLKYKPFKRFLLSIHHHPAQDQKKHLSDFMNDWIGDYDQIDDICVLGIKL